MTKGRLSIVACAALLLCLCAEASAQTRTRRPARPAAAQTPTNGAPQTRTTEAADAPRPAVESQQPQPAGAGQQTVSPEEADVAITATVRARELTFEVVPNPSVEFPGRPTRRTVWEAERENLPRPVRPGETYRDIGVRLRILSVFADIDRIVAEALGEVPPTDDTPTPLTTQPTTLAPQPPATPPSQTPAPPAPPASPQPTDTGRRP